jgi:hypothetical protein
LHCRGSLMMPSVTPSCASQAAMTALFSSVSFGAGKLLA